MEMEELLRELVECYKQQYILELKIKRIKAMLEMLRSLQREGSQKA